MADLIVTTVAEWLALPEIVLPALKSNAEMGSVYNVRKVGFLAVAPNELPANLSAATELYGKRLLPTAVTTHGTEPQLCRLPLDLSAWASHCVQVAHAGTNPFPSEVEFGRLQGRAYAEIK